MTAPIQLVGSAGDSALLIYPLRGPQDVVEGGLYKFVYRGGTAPSSISPCDMFTPDPDDPTMGRLKPMNHVGTVDVVIDLADGRQDRFELEVAPSKLSDDSDYRALLEQVADFAAEAVLQGFAPAHRMMAAQPDAVGELDYRSLAFVAARLRDSTFQAAIERILQHPHRHWVTFEESRPLGRGVQAGAMLGRQLVRGAGRSSRTPDGLRHLGLSHVPTELIVQRNDTTYDTNPNRVIRFVFTLWQGLASNIERRLQSSEIGVGPRKRGLAEARWVMSECDRFLASDVLRDVRPLRSFPHGDPVLLRQPGYREVLRAFALGEASMTLHADLDDDLFAATMRNTATLYEYWTFLVLVRCLTDLCGDVEEGAVFEESALGLSLVLRQGQASKLSWTYSRGDRDVAVDLWFNRSFSRGESEREISSWASAIRPDASMRLRPLTGRPREVTDPHLDSWVHFDAKFRLDVQGADVTDDDPVNTAKRTDLLKMHAYRDLIRRSAGAYVLYPGTGGSQTRKQFHEVLPGIGAFPLRPAPQGAVHGAGDLGAFLAETMELAANQASANERARFWQTRHSLGTSSAMRAVNFLDMPPADELVLLGYVRDDQLEWVGSRRRYNLRADGRRGSVLATDQSLGARLILLWAKASGEPQLVGLFERTGPWQIVTAEDLRSDGYPSREIAVAYLVAAINPVTSYVDALVLPPALLDLPDDSRPRLTTWDRVASTVA